MAKRRAKQGAKLVAKKLRIAVVGASGRMGQETLALAGTDKEIEIVAGVSRAKAAHAPITCSRVHDLPQGKIDVLIDFSLPDLTDEVSSWCASNKVALVSGVTGISTAQKKKLISTAKSTAVLWAPNMSLGVAVMADLLAAFSALEGFEFQIEETHHKRKKDRPSGTALFLQEKLTAAVGPVPDPLAIRGGGVFGIHKVWAMAEEETITIEHTAMNRKVFARGALRAARWIVSRKPGYYNMADVVKR